jgi:hypothetical protein
MTHGIFKVGDLVSYDFSGVKLATVDKHGIVLAVKRRSKLPPLYEVKWTNGDFAGYESYTLILMAKGDCQPQEVIDEPGNKENGV